MYRKILKRLFIHNLKHANVTDFNTTIDRLKAGNKHFTSYVLKKHSPSNIERVRYLAKNGQSPIAVLVTCSDARISPERIFNAEMGDFFIIRTAGNVVGELEIGSIEYALTFFKIDTVVVMGHGNCGAIKYAICNDCTKIDSVKSIANIIQPSIDKAKSESNNDTELVEKAENYNILYNVNIIKNSKVVKELVDKNCVTVVGAKYGISTGEVTFFK